MTSTRFSFPPAKKASDRPSGDQNGSPAPSVPGSARAVGESSDRSHNTTYPEAFGAVNAIVRPSGETAGAGLVPKARSGADSDSHTAVSAIGARQR